MPRATLAAYGLMRLTGLPLPTPHVPLLAAPVMFLAFFVGAVGEEVGWSGYATDAMQARWNSLEAGILPGLVGAAWHIIQLAQVGRSPAWIAWWCLWTVAARVLIVWLCNNTGRSVFAAVLFHAMMNVSRQLFPNYGSHWDPRVNGLMLALVAAVVTGLWRPRNSCGRRTPRTS